MNLFEGMIKNNDNSNKNSNQQTNLLNMGTNNNQNNNINNGTFASLGFRDNSHQDNTYNINNVWNQGIFDLLVDIFGGGSTTNNANNININDQNQNNIFEAFGNNSIINIFSSNTNDLFINLDS